MNKILTTLMAVVVAMTMNATTLYVNGNKLTESKTISTGGGMVTFDSSNKTLTVINVNFSRTGSGNNGIDNQDVSGLRIIFKGTNNIEIANADVINCQAATVIEVADGTTTLSCTANDQNAIKARGADIKITGAGLLYLKSSSGAVVEGKNGSESCTMKIRECHLSGGRNKWYNFNTLEIQSFDKNAMRSTQIYISKGEKYGYGPIKNVKNLLFDTNVWVSHPDRSTTEMLTYDANYGSTFIISDDHEDATATTIGSFQYKAATINGTAVAKLVGPTIYWLKNGTAASVSIPGFVKLDGKVLPVYVGENAFLYLDVCQWLRLEYGVAGVGDNAFGYAFGLEKVYLPSSVKQMGTGVFNLSGRGENFTVNWATLDVSEVSLQAKTFDGILATNKLCQFPTIPSVTLGQLNSAITNYLQVSPTAAPESCHDYGEGYNYFVVTYRPNFVMALVGSSASALTLPVTTFTTLAGTFHCNSIAPKAFMDNTKLTSVSITNPELNAIDTRAFDGTTNLKKVTINCEALVIGDIAFARSGVTDVTLDGVSRLNIQAFYNCLNLKNVELPAMLNYIGTEAFAGDKSLATIKVKMDDPYSLSYGTNIFTNVNKQTCKLTVPTGKLSSYKACWPWSDFFNIEAEGGLKGDVNGDGNVNGSDITALYECILNNITPVGNPDVNADGNVNGTDVTVLYNILLQ